MLQVRGQYQETHNGVLVAAQNVGLEDSDMKSNALESFAAVHDLSFQENVFHGSVGVELRKNAKDGVYCVGFIDGGTDIEIYVRKLGKSHVLINDKLWLVGSVLRLFGYTPTGNYRCVARFRSADFDVAKFITVAQRELSLPPSGSPLP